MLERFTAQARQVLTVAQQEARMLGHDYVGTEHVLLALIHQGRGTAAQALESLGITEQAARRQVEEIAGRGQQQGPPRGHLPFTPGAKKVLELAWREAFQLGHHDVGTAHILLGLIREGEGKGRRPAAGVLNGLGVDPDRVRQQVVKLLSARRGEDDAGARPVTASGGKRELQAGLGDRVSSIKLRLSILEQRVDTGPDVHDLDREIAQVRRDREAALGAHDFENAAVLRDREKQLLSDQAAREREWTTLRSLSWEIERLRDLLRRIGIDPQDGAA